jgi:hypothetical protein
MKLLRSLALWGLLLSALLPAGAAAAETHSFLNTDGGFPSLDGGLSGPSTSFPSSIEVAGVPGIVTDVTLTSFGLTANQDLDMVLVGPNGAQVMLMSDACSSTSLHSTVLTFTDAGSIFIPQLSCSSLSKASVKPTNYEPESDNLASAGGPAGPYTNSLAAFDGISPNGNWRLFLLDDAPLERVGFELAGFALNLEVEPPPPTPPPAPEVRIQTVTVPGPTVTVPAAPAPQGPTAKTGKRAAALAKCAKKKSKAKKAQCKAAAQKLPA